MHFQHIGADVAAGVAVTVVATPWLVSADRVVTFLAGVIAIVAGVLSIYMRIRAIRSDKPEDEDA